MHRKKHKKFKGERVNDEKNIFEAVDEG